MSSPGATPAPLAQDPVSRRLSPHRRRLAIRATKSLIGSVVATIVSEITFASCYGFGLLGTTACSAVAFVAGAIPNYILNRQWAWQRRGRVRVGREVVLYLVVSVVSFAASAVATGAMNHKAHRITSDHLLKVALVSGAYLMTYVVLFGVKFALYEWVIFVDPSPTAAPSGAATPATPAAPKPATPAED